MCLEPPLELGPKVYLSGHRETHYRSFTFRSWKSLHGAAGLQAVGIRWCSENDTRVVGCSVVLENGAPSRREHQREQLPQILQFFGGDDISARWGAWQLVNAVVQILYSCGQ